MIPREILKKIRQIEIRINRLVSRLAVSVCPGGTNQSVFWSALTCILLYLPFHLSLSGTDRMGRWDRLPACRPEGSGADEFVVLWHWLLAKCAGSLSRSCLCPKLEPLIERPTKARSHLQE